MAKNSAASMAVTDLQSVSSSTPGQSIPRKPAGPRAAARRANEERILAAAEEVFALAGFTGATTAAIARRASLPKANVHYYFRTKKALYRAVLNNIIDLWLNEADSITEDADPAEALSAYVRAKVAYSQNRPFASKVFANEVVHGGSQIKDYLEHQLKARVEGKVSIIRRWIAEGRMGPVDPYHLFFSIWAATQTYADFECQAAAVLGKDKLTPGDYRKAADHVEAMILKSCDLEPGRAVEP